MLLSFLIVLWVVATELVHRLPPTVAVYYASHTTATNAKAKYSLHILQGHGHLAARKVRSVGLWPPPVLGEKKVIYFKYHSTTPVLGEK
jgi:hypothetical protein